MKRHAPGRGVTGDQQQPELLIDPVRVPAARSSRPQSGPTHLTVHHLGTRRGDDPEPTGGGPPAQLDPVPEAGDVGIQAVEGVPVGAADEHPAGGDAEVLSRLVTLTLVDLAEIESEVATTRAGDADADLAELVTGAVSAAREDQLGAGDVDAGVGDHVAEELLEGVGGRYRVVVQQPEPVIGFSIRSGGSTPARRPAPRRPRLRSHPAAARRRRRRAVRGARLVPAARRSCRCCRCRRRSAGSACR